MGATTSPPKTMNPNSPFHSTKSSSSPVLAATTTGSVSRQAARRSSRDLGSAPKQYDKGIGAVDEVISKRL